MHTFDPRYPYLPPPRKRPKTLFCLKHLGSIDHCTGSGTLFGDMSLNRLRVMLT